jgi:ABC-type nitrate/sulfonate/bicarbonate transport system ATPase subunit
MSFASLPALANQKLKFEYAAIIGPHGSGTSSFHNQHMDIDPNDTKIMSANEGKIVTEAGKKCLVVAQYSLMIPTAFFKKCDYVVVSVNASEGDEKQRINRILGVIAPNLKKNFTFHVYKKQEEKWIYVGTRETVNTSHEAKCFTTLVKK